jgi:hypothetical protein
VFIDVTPWYSREGLLFARSDDSNYSSTRHEVEDENNDGENQQDMDPSAKRVTADESYDPEDEKNDCDCPKHCLRS